jgi:hypothetical protein
MSIDCFCDENSCSHCGSQWNVGSRQTQLVKSVECVALLHNGHELAGGSHCPNCVLFGTNSIHQYSEIFFGGLFACFSKHFFAFFMMSFVHLQVHWPDRDNLIAIVTAQPNDTSAFEEFMTHFDAECVAWATYCGSERAGIVGPREIDYQPSLKPKWKPHLESLEINMPDVMKALDLVLVAIRHKFLALFKHLASCRTSAANIRKLLPPISMLLAETIDVATYESKLAKALDDMRALMSSSECDFFCEPLYFVPMFQCSVIDFNREYAIAGEFEQLLHVLLLFLFQ